MTSSPPFEPPTADDIRAAAQRIAPTLPPTPLLAAPDLSQRTGGQIYLKAENLNVTGSFKIRGATNFLLRLQESDPQGALNGVVAYSSGNHAQAVAVAARDLGLPATIVMPADAPLIKLNNTRAYGATVVTYDRATEDRVAIAADIAADNGAVLVPPYDHPWTIAGQGTTGLEIAAQAAEIDRPVDTVLVNCGGGGLTAGIVTALADVSPETRVYTVEPAGFDDTARSLERGEPVTNKPGPPSICDALLSPKPGDLTFPVNRAHLAGGLVVTDDQVREAMAYAFSTAKLVLEPGGAASLAALLADPPAIDLKGQTIVAVLTGGNVDPEHLLQRLTP